MRTPQADPMRAPAASRTAEASLYEYEDPTFNSTG